MSDQFPKTERTTLRRLPKRGVYDKETVFAILDEGLVCHVGFAVDGHQFVIPTAYGRKDETIFLHGSAISRTLNALGQGIDVCVTVTLIDGMVVAKSAFHHSMNYRSVMVSGQASIVTDPAEKIEALAVITNHLLPGRWEEVRETTKVELNATSVLALPMTEVSAKIRTGGPIDDSSDIDLPIWTGVIPVGFSSGEPVVYEGRGADGAEAASVGMFRAVHAKIKS